MSLDKPMTHTTTRQMNLAVVNHMFDEMCFNQMHASKGIQLFKERAVAALFKEYKQLNDMAVVGKVSYEQLTDEDKKRALRAINLIKEKKDGKIKGRTCADGSKHRKFVPREVDVKPEFKEDVRFENGMKVLYVLILKALYGMIESALLWYELFSTVLKEEEFDVNKIDKCIAQKYVNGNLVLSAGT